MKLPDSMQAMVLNEAGKPLVYQTVPVPFPSARQVLVKVIACGMCRTDLHIFDGELEHPKFPLIPGHEIVGTVIKTGIEVTNIKEGDTVGISWLGNTCGKCRFCLNGQENLCEQAVFTGYTINGGYAEYTVAYDQFCFPISLQYANAAGTPLLCAGLIGFRAYNMIDEKSKKIGIYGFGAAAHILIQIATYQGKKIYAFTRPGDTAAQEFAKNLGASWTGDSLQSPPEKLDAAIIFAPAGYLVPKALQDLDKGGMVVCGGIHMTDIPSFPYKSLWEERIVRSVANLTRNDADKFLKLLLHVPIQTETRIFHLQQANEAVEMLRAGQIRGAAVLVPG